jgi:hypothetical protein
MIKLEKILKISRIVFYGISILVFAFFAFIIYSHVFATGVSRADDAYIATGAKSLAFGYGYSSSITPRMGRMD